MYMIETGEYPDMPELANDYFNYLLVIKNKSPKTIEGYRKDLRVFFKFMIIRKKKVDPKKIDFDDIDITSIDIDFIKSISIYDLYAFLGYVEKTRNNAAITRNRKVKCIRSFYKYLQRKAKLITENPALELETSKIGERVPIYLKQEECLKVLDNLDKRKKNYYRDYAILVLFICTGIRLSELCNIKYSDINNDILRVIGKGNKERIVYLTDDCIKAINEYTAHKDFTKIPEEYQKYVFISTRNKPINPRTVEILVKKHIMDAGLNDKKYTPHKLRHTCATLLYKKGVEVATLQQILGHTDISTTMIYTHVESEEVRAAMRNNPLLNDTTNKNNNI